MTSWQEDLRYVGIGDDNCTASEPSNLLLAVVGTIGRQIFFICILVTFIIFGLRNITANRYLKIAIIVGWLFTITVWLWSWFGMAFVFGKIGWQYDFTMWSSLPLKVNVSLRE